MRTRRVEILLFDEVEILDAAGPFEVFSVASRVAVRRAPSDPPPFVVTTTAAGADPVVRARGELRFVADHRLDEAPDADIVIVPGGVTEAVEADPAVLAWVRAAADTAEVVASVCTGALVLAEAGLLNGLTATTHWADLDELRTRFPTVEVLDGPRFVDHGRVATSAGVSAGIDLALHLVGRLTTEDLARETARLMDYPWSP